MERLLLLHKLKSHELFVVTVYFPSFFHSLENSLSFWKNSLRVNIFEYSCVLYFTWRRTLTFAKYFFKN